ncbi:MAG: GGDEF domain-containing protein [Proteobacteria bacterium]|nr:GGDEF domain-containing protein [Pseudomonadota bacterium]MBU1742467.1 GGDEF domain-containing protein [Pseudomonadota bacterium]
MNRLNDDDRLFHQALGIARKVLPFIGERRIPPTPENYMLWYEYFQGHSPQITARLDQLLADQTPFTFELTRGLFDEFFGQPDAIQQASQLNRVADLIRTMALRIVKESIKSIESSSAYSASLAKFAAEIEQAQNVEDISRVLAAILDESQRVREANQAYQKAIRRQTQDVDTALGRLKSLELEATTDALTGLSNRRAFDREIEREFSRAKRYGNQFGLIFGDLDEFKRINDAYGHQIGDTTLKEVARLIRHIVREMDFTARYGGEELVIIVPGTSLDGARRLAERLRLAIAGTDFAVNGEDFYSLTISLGVAVVSPEDTSPADVIRRADQALYLSKRRGKNRICTEADLASDQYETPVYIGIQKKAAEE